MIECSELRCPWHTRGEFDHREVGETFSLTLGGWVVLGVGADWAMPSHWINPKQPLKKFIAKCTSNTVNLGHVKVIVIIHITFECLRS